MRDCRDAAAGRAAGLCSFELLAVRDAAADFFNNFTQGGTHRDLNKAGVVDLTAECEHLGALGSSRCPWRRNHSRSVEDDLRDVGIGLNVIQNGRLAEQALECRERRTADAARRACLRWRSSARSLRRRRTRRRRGGAQGRNQSRCRRCFCQAGRILSAWLMAICRR